MAYMKIIAAVIAGEMLIKEYICEKEREGKKKWKLPGGIEVCRLENAGAAGGVFADRKKEIRICSGAVLGGCGLMLLKEWKKQKVSAKGIGLSLLIGGGLCNFVDRMKKGTVTDYIRFTKCPLAIVRKLVFNISDFCILIGGLLLFAGRKFRIKS
ncbi:MAG TPA: signal peptidase II [Candidatus Anaerobutyricum avicola]|mgnify:FL=1|nr:signal peptidase II [Candidatus Anaerobutyricum avicola]